METLDFSSSQSAFFTESSTSSIKNKSQNEFLAKLISVARRIFLSPTLQIATTTLLLPLLPLPTCVIVPIAIGIGVLANKGKMVLELSFIHTLFRYYVQKMPWSHEVIPGIHLGTIPLKEYGRLDQLSELGIKKVITLLEPHECAPFLWGTPIKKAEWESRGIDQKILETSDFAPLAQDTIEQAVRQIEEGIAQGGGLCALQGR